MIAPYWPLDASGVPDRDAGTLDPELRTLGSRAQAAFARARAVEQLPVLLILLREVAQTNIDMVEPSITEVAIDVHLRYPAGTLAGEPDGLFVWYSQVYRGHTVLAAPDATEKVRALLERSPDRWECWWKSSEQALYWGSDPTQRLEGAPRQGATVVDPTDGFPIFVAGLGPGRNPVLPPLFFALQGLEAETQRHLLDFLGRGRTSAGFTWSVVAGEDARDRVTVLRDLARTIPAPNGGGIIETTLNVDTGLLEATSQTAAGALDSHRFSETRSRDFVLAGVPRALPAVMQRVIVQSPPPLAIPGPDGQPSRVIELGMREVMMVTLVLTAEDLPTGGEAHPALAPDTLACWLGVPLRWKNRAGATVTSVPPHPDGMRGEVRNAELRRLSGQIERGEVRVDVPLPYRGAGALPRGGGEGG